MGIFDAIKDALTVDDQERYEAAAKELTNRQAELAKNETLAAGGDERAQRSLDALRENVAAAQAKVDELAAKAGVATSAPAEAPVEAEPMVVETPADDPVAETIAAAEPVAEPVTEPVAEPIVAEPMVAEAPAPAAPAEPVYREYTVKKGDTLSHIGKAFGVKWRDIAALNNIANPDLIFPGQVFKIPN